jgi:GNAT superfamily N-acetyltransferase
VTPWRSRRLTAQFDISRFDCGNETLNRWLTEQALRAEQAGISATTAWTPHDDDRVVAYYTVAPTQLLRGELPSRSMAGGHSVIPGYLLGRLALDRSLHGRGVGSQLLLDALDLIVSAADRSGGRVLVVDAIDDNAAAFYVHHGFAPIPETQRLIIKIATARTALGR